MIQSRAVLIVLQTALVVTTIVVFLQVLDVPLSKETKNIYQKPLSNADQKDILNHQIEQNSEQKDPIKQAALKAQEAQIWFCKNVHPLPAFSEWVVSKPNHAHFESFTDLKVKSQVEKMHLLRSDLDIVSGQISGAGFWEATETIHFLKVMGKAAQSGISDPLFLDIGSNIGWFSTTVAAFGFRVFSVDAMRGNGQLFRSTLCDAPKELMDRVTFFNVVRFLLLFVNIRLFVGRYVQVTKYICFNRVCR
jgi:hypothetical protein